MEKANEETTTYTVELVKNTPKEELKEYCKELPGKKAIDCINNVHELGEGTNLAGVAALIQFVVIVLFLGWIVCKIKDLEGLVERQRPFSK